MNDPLKTLLGTEIPTHTRGILYICKLHEDSIEVVQERLYESEVDALNAYANIPNPESHVAMGKDFDTLIKELITLHKRLGDPEYAKELHNFI